MLRYLAVSGTIGAGKTELAKIIAARFKGQLVLEEFAHNTFLEKFYNHPERYAFPLEISFLFERYQQLSHEFSRPDLFSQFLVSDYIFDKSLLFARNNLSDEHFKVFYTLYTAFAEQLPRPDLIFYLHRPVEVLLKNIHKRGRTFEQNISEEYLDNIQELYLQYLKTLTDSSVVIFELDNLDFLKDERVCNNILSYISRDLTKELTVVNVEKLKPCEKD